MKIIDNYRDLPIGMYLDICEINSRDNMEEIEKQVSIIALLTGRAEADIYNLPIDEYRELSTKLNFLSKEYDGEVLIAKTYTIGKWHLIPTEDFRKITTAQYIDFQTFMQEGEKRVIEILSTMLVPKGKKYAQDYDVVELQKTLRESLSVADALSLFAFFFVQFSQLIKDSLISCKEMLKKAKDKEKKASLMKKIQELETLLKDGVGLPM